MKFYGNLILMTVICVAVFMLFMAPRPAHAQGYFGGSDGGMGRSHGIMPTPGPYRAINISPTKGRPYSVEALPPVAKQRKPKARAGRP